MKGREIDDVAPDFEPRVRVRADDRHGADALADRALAIVVPCFLVPSIMDLHDVNLRLNPFQRLRPQDRAMPFFIKGMRDIDEPALRTDRRDRRLRRLPRRDAFREEQPDDLSLTRKDFFPWDDLDAMPLEKHPPREGMTDFIMIRDGNAIDMMETAQDEQRAAVEDTVFRCGCVEVKETSHVESIRPVSTSSCFTICTR